MSKMSEIHITLSNSRTRSTTVVQLVTDDPVTHRPRKVMLARYNGFSREEAADALHHWRENNANIANDIIMYRVERTSFY